MRDEQYLALAKATKRPMRRWWLTVGSWWLGGAAVLLVAQAIITVYEIQLRLAENWGLLSNKPLWHSGLNMLIWQLPQIILVLAVLCSHKVAGLVSQLCQNTPLQNNRETYLTTFRLAILNCWPTLIPIVCTYIITGFQLYYVRYGGLEAASRGMEFGLSIPIYYAILLLWTFALAIIPTVPRWISWVLYLSMTTSPMLLILWAFCELAGINELFPSYAEIDLAQTLTGMGFAILSVISMLMLYLIVFLFCRGLNRQAIWLACLVCLHITLDGVHAGFGIFPIDLFIQCGILYTESLTPIVLSPFGENLMLFSFSERTDFKFSWPAINNALSFISYAFWFALHYYLLSMMIRKVKPLKPKR